MFQVFQVFRVFQVLHVRFWTTKPPDFGPNPNKAEKSAPTRLRHLMATENTQKGNSPTCQRTDTVLQAIAEVFFGDADFFFFSIPQARPLVAVSNERIVGEMALFCGDARGISWNLSNFAVN
ncbi:MAG: hypothetical protein ACI307_05765 [Sodaliphilus sp.]